MDIRFVTRGVELKDDLKDYMENKMSKLERFFSRIIDGQVVMSFGRGLFTVEITSNANGVIMRGQSSAPDMRKAFDQGLKNLFPQNGNFNVSAYKKLENEWADWVDSGKDVHITVELTPANQDRPDKVRVSYEVTDPADGRVVYDQRVTFRNEAGQQFDRVPRADMANA